MRPAPSVAGSTWHNGACCCEVRVYRADEGALFAYGMIHQVMSFRSPQLSSAP
jgi:hypothetical protein